MKLNGALEPRGAYPIGGSIGAKNKYRDKIHSNKKNNNSTNNITRNNNQKSSSTVDYRKNIHNIKPVISQEDSDNNIDNNYCCSNSNTIQSQNVNRNFLQNLNQLDRFRLNNNNNKSKSTTIIAKKDRMMSGNVKQNGIYVAGGNMNGKFNNKNNKMRVQQSLFGYKISSSLFILCLFYVFILLPNQTYCDDNDNSFFINHLSPGPEMTTPEFDYASRGNKKFGDKCNNTLECGFPGSICDSKKKACQCTEDLPITNHIDKCGKEAAHNESCFFNEQCESFFFQTECRDGRCICRFELQAVTNNGKFDCVAKQGTKHPEQYVDPAMIGILLGMALMFIIICVVLRLFSQARWHENRTIFNTPNPRLMNVSLLRESKLLHGQERRGSRMSVRAPSRQPSMASLRPHSPNPSLGKTAHRRADKRFSITSNHLASRPGSRGSNSNGSGHSFRSRSDSTTVAQHNNNHNIGSGGHHPHNHHHHNEQRKNSNSTQHQPLIANIVSNPVAENVTVEIIEPTKEQTDI